MRPVIGEPLNVLQPSSNRFFSLSFFEVLHICVQKLDKKLKLAMIGDGPLMGKVRQVLEARNIGNSVELFGFLDGDEKIEVFLNSKIFAHPAIYDTGGLAPMEAMVLMDFFYQNY